jgi:hypothetical protein
MDFNSHAELHPCMQCEHGAVWREQSKPAGNVCKHPEICKRKGLYYGRYHTLKKYRHGARLSRKVNISRRAGGRRIE